VQVGEGVDAWGLIDADRRLDLLRQLLWLRCGIRKALGEPLQAIGQLSPGLAADATQAPDLRQRVMDEISDGAQVGPLHRV